MVTALETLSTDKLTLSFTKNRLLHEESKRHGFGKKSRNDLQSSSVFVVPTNHGNEKNFTYKCYSCGEIGHKRSDCKKRTNLQRGYRNSNTRSANVAMQGNEREERLGLEVFCFPAFAGNRESSILCWYLDSGASEHMVRDDTVLDNVKQLDMPISIKIAKSGETMIARHTGEAIVEAEVHGRKNLITIQDILVIPGLEL